jgi:membrane protease YdiL (CAAX protease family)
MADQPCSMAASSQTRFRPMPVPARFVLPIFFAVIFLGTMVLGPLLFFALAPWHIPFHRAMDRALLISAVAALGFFWSRIDFRVLWPWNAKAWKQVLLGVALAVVSIQAMMGFDLAAAGFSSSHLSAGKAWGRVLMALVAAVIAAPVEETIFRGFLQREFSQGLGWRAGWILGAAVYALAHFLKIPVELDKQPVHFWSGASALGAAFAHLGCDLSTQENLLKALNLVLVGLILGGVFLRSGSLWLNAGLHGGWIFGLLVFTGFTHQDEPPRVALFGGNILSNLGTTVVLIIQGLWLWRFYRHPSVQPTPAPATGPSAR